MPADAVQLKLLADNQQLAAHVEQLRKSSPEFAVADEPQHSSIRERGEEWCRRWHPRFPLPAPGADPPLLCQRNADGSWQRVSQADIGRTAFPAGTQMARDTVLRDQPDLPWEQPTQLSSQRMHAPLHVVLPDGTLGVLAANVWANGQQGPWQPVLVSSAAPALSAAASGSQHRAPPSHVGNASIIAQGAKRPADIGEGVHQNDLKRRCPTPHAGAGSNQAAARLLRKRMHRRSEPTNPDPEHIAGCAAQQKDRDGSEQGRAVQLDVDFGGDGHRQRGMAAAPLAMAAAQCAPFTAAGTAGSAIGAFADPAVPQCLWRMVAAGDDSEIVFLGTGCAEPSKYRGASGILLRPDPDPLCVLRLRIVCSTQDIQLLMQHRILSIGCTTCRAACCHAVLRSALWVAKLWNNALAL